MKSKEHYWQRSEVKTKTLCRKKIGHISRVWLLYLSALIAMNCQSSAPVGDVPDASLMETYWKLTELGGQSIPLGVPEKREAHIILKNGNRLQGFAGCNAIMGSFEVKNDFSITFSGVASTMMACPDMKMEDDLKKVLEQVDNYSIEGNTLSMSKARTAPLARFEAVYLK